MAPDRPGRDSARLHGWSRAHAGVALLLVGCVALRDAEWVLALDLLAAAALGSLALADARTWPGVLRGLVAVPYASPWAAAWASRGLGRLPVPAVWPVARGLLLTAGLLGVFGVLLVSADPVFAAALDPLLPGVPDLGALPARAVVGGLAAGALVAAVLVRVAPRPEPVVGPPARMLARRSEWALPLWSLDLLLAAFVAVQARAAVAGDGYVRAAAGVTYASYAREGFGQLLVVTALVLAVVAAAARWAPRAARPGLAVLCGLALVIDLSAFARLQLYSDAYGLTRLRVLATAVTVGLGVVLVLVLGAGLVAAAGRGPARWLPHAVVLTVGLSLLTLTLVDPDRRIAESGLARGAAADLDYLATLSADAVPALDRLPEPARSCLLPDEVDGGGWLSANVARARAAALLAERPRGVCRLG